MSWCKNHKFQYKSTVLLIGGNRFPMSKLEKFCDGPFELDPTLFSEFDLPKIKDVFNHYFYLYREACKLDTGRFSTMQLLTRVAKDVISVYDSLGICTVPQSAVVTLVPNNLIAY